jgi:DNA-directed RNA polymerase specialized sigma24 family protein
MTVAYDIRPRPELAGDDIRRGLTALLRRRVPGQEVDDLAQTILCDALAAGHVPSDPEELRRWLVGIARHKIADYHRRQARVGARDGGEAPLATYAAAPAPLEERDVLQQLLGEVRSRRDVETLEWLVREHGGEQLADIAKESGLEAANVRQRVSRLRRVLRSRWAGAVGVLIVVAAATAALWPREVPVAIQPEQPVVLHAPATVDPPPTTLSHEIEGDWIVQSVQPARELTPTEQRFVDTYSRVGRLHVEDGKVTLTANAFKESWMVMRVDDTTVTMRSTHGESETALVAVKKGDRLEVRLPNHPRLAGTVVLKRPVD